MKRPHFFPTKITFENLDVYLVKKSINKALEEAIPLLSGDLLDVGCGEMPYKNYILDNSEVSSYIGLDIESAKVYNEKVKPDFIWDGITIPFEENTYDCLLLTEVLEHCPNPDSVLSEAFRILKPQGVLFLTVPFLWPLHEVPHDEYRYTPFALKRFLGNAGFKNVNLKATGGWHAAMAQMLGLWIKRSGMSQSKMKLFHKLSLPFIKYLIKKDQPKSIKFVERQMITGLYGIIKK